MLTGVIWNSRGGYVSDECIEEFTQEGSKENHEE